MSALVFVIVCVNVSSWPGMTVEDGSHPLLMPGHPRLIARVKAVDDAGRHDARSPMRPTLLNPLFAPVTSLPGVGPKQDKLLRYLLSPRRDAAAGRSAAAPAGQRDRPPGAAEDPRGGAGNHGDAGSHRGPPPAAAAAQFPRALPRLCLRRYRRRGADVLPRQARLCRKAAAGRREALRFRHAADVRRHSADRASRPRRGRGRRSAKLTGIDPVYPLTEGLALGSLRRAIAQALQKLPDLPEWISPEVIRRCSFPPISEALNRVHVPVELTDILPDGPFWSRLAFDELLAGQLALALVRAQLRRPAGDRNAGDGHLRHRIIDALPYALTSSQREAVAAIAEDLRQPVRMLRLLQGDVGSGKTVVALLAAAAVVEAGKQAALMAPTEILARQHIKTIAPLAERAGLAGGDPDRPREGQGAARNSGAARSRRDRFAGRHPCADPGRRDLQGAGARRGRRTASLWRARTARADQQGRSGRCAGA